MSIVIKSDAVLSVRVVPLSQIHVTECQMRYSSRLMHYIRLLEEHPKDYAGCLFVKPSTEHADMFELLDGHHRFCASIICGRADALCVVIEERKKRV